MEVEISGAIPPISSVAKYVGMDIDLETIRRWLQEAHVRAERGSASVVEVRFRLGKGKIIDMSLDELVRRLTIFNPVEGRD